MRICYFFESMDGSTCVCFKWRGRTYYKRCNYLRDGRVSWFFVRRLWYSDGRLEKIYE